MSGESGAASAAPGNGLPARRSRRSPLATEPSRGPSRLRLRRRARIRASTPVARESSRSSFAADAMLDESRRTRAMLDPPVTGRDRVGSAQARVNFSRVDNVQSGLPVRRNRARSRQRLRQSPVGHRSRDCAPPSTNGQGMSSDLRHRRHRAGTVWASRRPLFFLTRPSTARFRCLRVCPSTLEPKGREPVRARVREVRPNAHTRCVAIDFMPRGASDSANTAARNAAASPGAAT